MRHYSTEFLARGGHRAVAEVLNEKQCEALRCIVKHFCSDSRIACLPLHVCAMRVSNGWSVSSLKSADEWESSVRKSVRRRSLKHALLRHGGAEVHRVHEVLACRGAAPPLVVRLTIVFEDESSHVNALVFMWRSGVLCAELFEPKVSGVDTTTTPFATLRHVINTDLCHLYNASLPVMVPSTTLVLQTNDDLCQTWVALYVVERLKTPLASQEEVLRRMCSSRTPGCDRLCALMQFSEQVYNFVPFRWVTRRGECFDTLLNRRFSTSRNFRATGAACVPPPPTTQDVL